MIYKKLILPTLVSIFLVSCGGTKTTDEAIIADENDPIGAVKYVLLEDPLEEGLIEEGTQIYKEKCIKMACCRATQRRNADMGAMRSMPYQESLHLFRRCN